MESLRIVFLICGPLLLLATFLLLRFYNNGYGQLRSKKWAVWMALFTFIVSIISVVLYIKTPKPNEIDIAPKEIETLAEMEEMVSYLESYIQDKKGEILTLEQKLERLEDEHSELVPIVEIERETVETVLNAFDYWSRKRIWYEYLGTFIIGILSTLVVTLFTKKPSHTIDKGSLGRAIFETQKEQERRNKYFK
jgi:hypothetical protein